LAAVVEHDDAVAQQTPALPGVIGDDPGCQVIGCRPLRAPRLMLTHCFLRYKAVRAMPSRASCPQYRPSPGRAPVRACVADPLRLPGFTICDHPLARPGEPTSRDQDDFRRAASRLAESERDSGAALSVSQFALARGLAASSAYDPWRSSWVSSDSTSRWSLFSPAGTIRYVRRRKSEISVSGASKCA
jgi:hypothetical protein